MLISILIPTYRRPEDLTALLGDLLAEARAGAVMEDVEILVLDNCPDRSAEAVAAGFAADLPLTYLSEPRPGVAQARNRGVSEARGRYVLFVDDDERPGENWLHHWREMAARRPDAAFGAVHPVFDTAPAPGLTAGLEGLFSREMNLPDGTDITARRAFLGTGNSLFDRARCFAQGLGFDPAMTAGGEDVALLRQLVEERGVKLLWSARTPVRERVPAARMTASYVRARKFRNGQLRCLVEAGGGHWGRVGFWMAAGLAQALGHGGRALLLSPFDRAGAQEAFVRAAGGLGKVMWWR